MTRWDYDTVFYRVFCITLLAVAFTFTVILTNVFVDIDGLLSKKDKGKPQIPEPIKNDMTDVINVNMLPNIPDDKSEDVYEDKDYQDSNDLYRSKRSLATQDIFHINDPKVKQVLTNHLATLLDQLDEEQSTSDKEKNDNKNGEKEKKSPNKNPPQNTVKEISNNKNLKSDAEITKPNDKIPVDDAAELREDKNKIEQNKKQKDEMNVKENELLHLAMHNIILQGIIGHMDLDEVYNKVHALVKNFERKTKGNDNETPSVENHINIHEKVNCKELHNQIVSERKRNDINAKDGNISKNNNKKTQLTSTAKHKGRNVMINTVIDINALTNEKANKDTDAISKENVNGIFKLIYNGKTIKFKKIDDDITTVKPIISKIIRNEKSDRDNVDILEKKDIATNMYVPNKYFNQMIRDYLKKFSKETDSKENDKVYSTKRIKRHVKIRFENEKTTAKPKNEDDDLFVEIETHFDSKGAKGDKKKKLIRDLIEKIQKAIRMDSEVKKKKHKHLHVKKRFQNPLGKKHAAALINKIALPMSTLVHREMNPISKSVPEQEKVPRFSDDSGTNWKKMYNGPGFFMKSINSAELSEVDTDYNKVMSNNGIPQRLQKPLNTDISDEALDGKMYNFGNIKYLVKDIEGSGFSIGFNRYIDEVPDAESMKVFTGLENVIETYHQKYDQEPETKQQTIANEDNLSIMPESNPNINLENVNEHQDYPEVDKTDEHFIVRRSIKQLNKHDHNSNIYNINNNNLLPFNNYRDIFNKNHSPNMKWMKKLKNIHKVRDSSLIVDENVFEKDLKPAEILSIADLFERRKRSLNVKKFSNVKKKINRYLNTKSMATKSIFLNKKRNKRQIDKIRIIARELPHTRRQEEDIFVVSDEKIFADRAVVREVETSEMNDHVHDDRVHTEEQHFDIISPQKVPENYYDNFSPYVFETPTFETQSTNNFYSKRSNQNSLMSKYPHILMEEISRSKEENNYPENPISYGQMIENYPIKVGTNKTTLSFVSPKPVVNMPAPKIQNIAPLIPPAQEQSNYKVTVKIMPKNSTILNSGFKEVHTSINKSYNKNGLVYTSLVNVSEVSKVEKANKNISRRHFDNPTLINFKQQQELIKSLIRQHKNRIDEQLAHLNKEREKLETIKVEDVDRSPTVNIPLPINPANQLHITKEEANKLLCLGQQITTEAPQIIFTEPTILTTQYIQPTTVDPDKARIISTMERNGNITSAILKKIDLNTGILQTFLKKLIAKIESETQKPQVAQEKPTYNNIKRKYINKNQSKENLGIIPFDVEQYQQNMDNILYRNIAKDHRNGTMAIPFVYAYQQPYMTPNKEVAHIVYHGLIHTNTVNNKEIKNTENYKPNTKDNPATDKDIVKEKEVKIENEEPKKGYWKNSKSGDKFLNNFIIKNNTRFFVDDFDREYTIPPLNEKKNFAPVGVTINVTQV